MSDPASKLPGYKDLALASDWMEFQIENTRKYEGSLLERHGFFREGPIAAKIGAEIGVFEGVRARLRASRAKPFRTETIDPARHSMSPLLYRLASFPTEEHRATASKLLEAMQSVADARALSGTTDVYLVSAKYHGRLFERNRLLRMRPSEAIKWVTSSDFFENAGLPIDLPQARPPQTATFEPSWLLTKFLVPDSTSLPREDHRAAALKLREVVLGLLQSILDAHVYGGKTEPYQISERSRFVRSFTKAIQGRIDLDPYKVGDFLSQLHRELCNSSPLRVNNWVLQCTSDGSMSLSHCPLHRNEGTTGERARVVRMKFGRRGNENE